MKWRKVETEEGERNMSKNESFDPVIVEWEDAQTTMDSFEIEKILDNKIDPIITKSCGFLMREDKNYVVISSMIFYEHAKHHQIIPRSLVKKIIYLKQIKRR